MTAAELQALLRRMSEYIEGDRVTEEDGKAIAALDYLADVYLPNEWGVDDPLSLEEAMYDGT